MQAGKPLFAPMDAVTSTFSTPDFVQVLQEVPTILQLLSSRSRAAVFNSSRQLRHNCTTQICIQQADFTLGDAKVLVDSTWPELQKLRIHVGLLEPDIAKVLLSACLPSLSSLSFAGSRMSRAVPQLAQSPWTQLQALDLSNSEINTAAVACLVQADWPHLKTLNLSGNSPGLTAEAIPYLVTGRWPELSNLCLADNTLYVMNSGEAVQDQPHSYVQNTHNYRSTYVNHTDYGVLAVSSLIKGDWPELISLDMERNLLGGECLTLLGSWPKLQCLNLSHNLFNHGSGVSFGHCCWPALTRLGLSQCGVTEAMLADLVQPQWSNLRVIDLSSNMLQYDYLSPHILSQGNWPLLESFDYSHNCMYASVAACITKSGASLQTLILSHSYLTRSLWAQWFTAQLPMLKCLNLCGSKLKHVDVQLLVQASWPLLMSVNLGKTGLTDCCAHALVKAHWPLLEHLNLSFNSFNRAGFHHVGMGTWPFLQRLDLSTNKWDDAHTKRSSYEALWPCLMYLQLEPFSVYCDDSCDLAGHWVKMNY